MPASRITHTDEVLSWARRCGGGYPTRDDAELAATFLRFPVTVGPADSGLGFIIVRTDLPKETPPHDPPAP